jgi:Do/DeqQ family serine protease
MHKLISALLLSLLLPFGVGPAAAQRRVPPPSKEAAMFSFAPVAKKAAPAVVNVYARGVLPPTRGQRLEDEIYRRFFGERFGMPEERAQNSLGSGVIVHPDGLVVTNTHVVKVGGNTEIKVVLSDKREFDAHVVMQDEKADIAILKLDGAAQKFDFLEFADSDDLEVGDLVLAIGNPFGVGQTVTQGIVSALARTEIGKSDVQVFIQTDAAINPGNSGGALVDMNGRLAGINTAIYSQTGASHGIGFAIPANLVKLFVESAVTGRKVARPWIGAKLEPVTRDIADALGIERASGAVVTRVTARSAAAEAGLQVGDVITSVDGTTVDDPRALTYRLTTRGIGARAKLELVRKNRIMTADLMLREAPEPGKADVRNLTGNHPFDGARVATLVPALADELGLDEEQGVVILSVRPGSVAANLGFSPGDVVLSVGGQPMDTAAALEAQFKQRQTVWQVDVKRQGRLVNLQIRG